MSATRPFTLTSLALVALTLFALVAPLSAAASIGPVITAVTNTPNPIPVAGGYETVTAKVTDSTAALSSVVLKEYYSNGYLARTAPMTVGSDGVTYTASVAVDPNYNSQSNGEYLVIVATDSANNQASFNVATQGYSNVAPSITNVSYSPDPIPAKGATVTVTAKVTDPTLGLSSVVLKEYYSNGYLARTAPMTVGSDGVTYTASVAVDPNYSSGGNGEYLVIYATDPAGNQASVNVATQGYSNVAPSITNVKYSPNPIPVQGATVTVTAKVTDSALGVSSVVLKEYYSNGYLARTAPMTVGSDGVTYTASVAVDPNSNPNGTGEYLILYATDPAGNQSSFNVATQGYSNVPPFGALPVLITGDANASVLNPTFVAVNSPELTLTINGINFAPGATVLFNGISLTPTLITATQIKVNIPPSFIAQTGSFAVSVLDPSPSGASNSVNLIVK